MSVETAIEAEAVAQALCMETEDFARAFRAFAAKQKPVFEGNWMASTRLPRAGRSSTMAIGASPTSSRAGPTPSCRRCRARRRRCAPAARTRRRRWASRLAQGGGAGIHGGLHPALDVRTLCLAREIARLPRRPRRFRLRHAGARHRRDLAVRLRRAEARAICRRCATAKPSRPSRCRSPKPARTSRRSRPRATPDGADDVRLDGEKTWISNGGIADITSCSRAPARRRARAGSRRSWSTPARRLHGRRADRGDRAASAGDAARSRRARAGGEPARQARRGVQGRDGDARHLPLDGRRRRAGLRPPRAARDRRARVDAASCSARRSPICR